MHAPPYPSPWPLATERLDIRDRCEIQRERFVQSRFWSPLSPGNPLDEPPSLQTVMYRGRLAACHLRADAER